MTRMPGPVAVVVAFNPGSQFAERVASYADQVDAIIIVDNSTEADGRREVAGAAERFPIVDVVTNPGNMGLALAQNIGIRLAVERGAPWVLLMDDDSVAGPGMVDAMLGGLAEHPHPDEVALLLPQIHDSKTNRERHFLVREGLLGIRRRYLGDDSWCDTVLTGNASGSLFRATVFARCGLMNEGYFVDWLDIEFCLRLRRSGAKILAVRDARLVHSVGEKTSHGVASLRFWVGHHRAWRLYTIYRNRVDVWKRFGRHFPGYVLYDMLVAVFESIKILAFEEQRAEKLSAMGRGVADGLRGRFPRPVS